MRDILEVFSEEQQLERLRELDAEECEAIFQLLMLAVLIDGEVTREEIEAVVDEFDHLPFFAAASTDRARREFGFQIRGELMERIANDELPAMLQEIRDTLDDEHLRPALRMLAYTASADHIADDDYAFGLEVADVFGIDAEEALEMFRKAWEYGHPPFPVE